VVLPTGSGSAIAAFEETIRRALERPPAVVAFSGGRDSSAVLAVATDVARREGHPEPVPATLRFPTSAESDESEWQERVVRHLRLSDWVRIEIVDELDCVGPYAQRALGDHGLLWPPNAHVLVPLLEQAADGSLLSGDGGDVVFEPSPWRRHVFDLLAGRIRPRPRDVLPISLAFGPARLRQRRFLRRYADSVRVPWLRPDAREQLLDRWSVEAAAEPLTLNARIPWMHGLRPVQVALQSFGVLAAASRAQLAHPFHEPGFVASLARAARSFRYADRTEAMRRLFAHVLPEDVCARSTKGGFRDVFWNCHARDFAARWRGEGADPELVDLDVLAAIWRSDEAREHFRSCTQLQAAWLAGRAPG
jgi:asparagine synthase (glutamine-hydrolysing)